MCFPEGLALSSHFQPQEASCGCMHSVFTRLPPPGNYPAPHKRVLYRCTRILTQSPPPFPKLQG